MFYLLLTGKYPTDHQLHELQHEWRVRGDLCQKTKNFILHLPREFHPMTMLSMTLLYLQPNSKFFKAYQTGVPKSKYWEFYYEDAMDLLAKLPQICAAIYRHKYRHSEQISELIPYDSHLDWAGNFSHMLGFQSKGMKECLRAYLSIHSDH